MIKIIDSIFSDPYDVRRIALTCRKKLDGDFFPGQRFDIEKKTKSYLFNQINRHIGGILSYRMSFNFIDSSYVTGICHADLNVKYTVIVYLTPNPPPNSGTEIFDNFYDYEKKYPFYIERETEGRKKFFRSSRNYMDRFFYRRSVKKSLKNQENKIEVANKFNRMVVYPGHFIHRPQDFFGKNKKDCRCTLLAYLN